jgi:predicted NAD/FAD-binding protein
MNRLQNLISSKDYFVSLNPPFEPGINMMHGVFEYEHPILTPSAIHTQRELKQIQGVGGVWFCGSYFGYGFHEDALSSGIAVASALGGLCPWHRENHIRETDDNCETVVLEVTHA